MGQTFIPESYTEAVTAISQIGSIITSQKTKGDRAIIQIDEVIADLGTLNNSAPVGWLETIQYINTEAAANPADEAWQDLKRKKDKLVSDYQAIQANFQAIAAAIDAV